MNKTFYFLFTGAGERKVFCPDCKDDFYGVEVEVKLNRQTIQALTALLRCDNCGDTVPFGRDDSQAKERMDRLSVPLDSQEELTMNKADTKGEPEDSSQRSSDALTGEQANMPSREKLREVILEKLEAENIPEPADLSLEVKPGAVNIEITFFDRPNVTLCCSENNPDPQQLAEDIVTLTRRKHAN